METHPETAAPALRLRADGWTPETQQAFIESLAQSGCVRQAAASVNRAVSGLYRLRAREDAHAFRAAWDAALGLAYTRLHEIAMDRIRNGLEQRTFDSDGNMIARKIVHNDRLLMFLLDHSRPDRGVTQFGFSGNTSKRFDPPSRDDEFGVALAALDAAPAGAGVLPPRPAPRSPFAEASDEELMAILDRGYAVSPEDAEEAAEFERRWAAGESFDDLLTPEGRAAFEDYGGDDDEVADADGNARSPRIVPTEEGPVLREDGNVVLADAWSPR